RQRGMMGRSLAVAGAAVLFSLSVATAGVAADDQVLPSGSVSLGDAVRAALRHDPTLVAFGFEEDARAARARQEGRLPNPVLGTEVENVARFGGDTSQAETAQTTISLTQMVELGSKRARQVDVAAIDTRLARRELERARLDTAARTVKAFVAGLLAQERVAVAERTRVLGRDSLAAVRRQLEAGGGSAIEVARAEAALAESEAVVARRTRESRAARVALAALWGDGEPAIDRLTGSLAPLPVPAPLATLRTRLATTPDLTRWTDAVARTEAGVALEEARRVPDLTVRVGARRFISAETNALVAEVALPLPFFDRNSDAIAEARARVSKMRAEQRAAELGAAATLRADHEEMTAAYEEARTLEAEVLPRARTALRETRRGYGEGRLRYLEVLEAERTITELEQRWLETLARYHTTAVEVERLTGGPTLAVTGEER
ncbi:MAG: TolC family protein, partial [Candidatus Binatia bacterium]